MSGWTSALIIARLTLTRIFRGRAVWISAIIAALPLAFAAAISAKQHSNIVGDILAFELLLIAIIPAMFVSASIGEDIEDRTTTYLWSRPVPRWSILVGKLLTLAPLSALVILTSAMASVYVGQRTILPAAPALALVAGTVVACFACAGIATLVPKHGMPLTISYMLFFDLPVGAMPISLAKLSITFQLRSLADVPSNVPTTQLGGAAGLAALSVVWLAIALWRIRRLEA